MRKGDPRTITLPDKSQVAAAYLGKGRHCTAYRRGDDVFCFVVEGDYSKDIIAEWVEDGLPHVPVVEKLGEVYHRKGECRKVYRMPFYPNVTAGDEGAWKCLRVLAESAERVFRAEYVAKGRALAVDGAYFARDVIDATRGEPWVPESVAVALESLADAMANYGCGWAFEFGKRNIGTDPQGRIVFRDIMFDAASVERQWRDRMKRARGY
jgi:hypothetical protein